MSYSQYHHVREVTIRFEIYGGFEVKLSEHDTVPRQAKNQKLLWEEAEQQEQGLPDACGCYVFAISAGGGIIPWYVGKAEKTRFKKECFGAFQINCYNDALARYDRGRPLLYLVSLLTPSGRLAQPKQAGSKAVSFLERWLIGEALSRNPNLCNIKDTNFLKNLIVPGLMGTKPGPPTTAQREFRKLLGRE